MTAYTIHLTKQDNGDYYAESPHGGGAVIYTGEDARILDVVLRYYNGPSTVRIKCSGKVRTAYGSKGE